MATPNTIQPHKINYLSRLIHYRGGSYSFRRISGHLKDEPDRKINSLVSNDSLHTILSCDEQCPIPEVLFAATQLNKKVAFFIPDILFLSPGVVIKDALERQCPDFEFTHVGD